MRKTGEAKRRTGLTLSPGPPPLQAGQTRPGAKRVIGVDALSPGVLPLRQTPCSVRGDPAGRFLKKRCQVLPRQAPPDPPVQLPPRQRLISRPHGAGREPHKRVRGRAGTGVPRPPIGLPRAPRPLPQLSGRPRWQDRMRSRWTSCECTKTPGRSGRDACSGSASVLPNSPKQTAARPGPQGAPRPLPGQAHGGRVAGREPKPSSPAPVRLTPPPSPVTTLTPQTG